MHLKHFPKRLDSKTSCLRISVPENLDLALEGLIRKVLREQPKTDYIHSFAADYFETLLKIRDKAGAKYTSAQLCPFHDDEDAHEMIKLASTFNKPLKKKSKEPPPPPSKGEKGTENKIQSRGMTRSKANDGLKSARKQNGPSTRTTADLTKKLAGNRPEEKKKGKGTEENEEEELLTSDPIKELVEEELKMEALAQKTEIPRAREGTRRGEPETNEAKEEANVPEGDKERSEIREENTKDLAKGNNGRSEATEEADEERGAKESKNKERTDEYEETSNRRTTDTEEAAEISISEKETEVRKDDAEKLSAEETKTKKMEAKTPEAEVTDAQIVEDKLPTAEKDRDREVADVKNTTDVPPQTVNMEIRNGESGTEIPSKEVKGEEKEPENSLRQPVAGSDGIEPQPEGVDTQLPEENGNSISEDKAGECLVAEVQEKSETNTNIESIDGEDVTTNADEADAVVEEAMKTTSSLLGEATDEHGIDAENADRQKGQPEPRMNSESEEKLPVGEEMLEGGSEMNENVKPERVEKSEIEEETTSAGGIANKENIIVTNEEVEDTGLATEEVPGEQEKLDPVKAEEESKANSLEQPKDHEKDEGSKGDDTAKQRPLEEEKGEAAAKEDAAGDEANKSGTKAQLLLGEDVDLERASAEAAAPSADWTAEAEKAEKIVDIRRIEPEQQDSKPDLTESQNEEQGDELCTVVDIQQVQAKDNEVDQKEDTKEPEEELCAVVDSQHIIRIEEPEAAKDNMEVPQSQEEVQIKRIQTHYYDTLKVPETLTKELRVHNVSGALPVAQPLVDLVKAESTGNVDNDNANTAPPAGFVESAQIKGSSAEKNVESALQQRADGAEKPRASERPNNIPLLVATPNQHELGFDTRRSETDDLLDLMTPTSGYSMNLSELSWQTVSGMFLDSERQHSSQLSDELRYATPGSNEDINIPEESHESAERRPEIEEVFYKTVLPTLVGVVPIPPRDAEEIVKAENARIPENAEEKRHKKPGGESFGGSSNDKSFDSDTPFISIEVKTVIETQVLDDDDEEGRPPLELKVEATVNVEDAEEETPRETEGSPEEEEKEMSGEQQKGGEGGPKTGDSSAEDRDGSGDRTAARKGSSGESDSTISSAATEIKRTDSGKRVARSERSLLTSHSLELGGRNPLLRTRSLSTFRHGVTDFEVWSAIEKELEEAATKIQARFRSYKVRKKLQRENAVQITTEESSANTTPAEAEERQQSTGEFHDSIVLSDHPR